MNIINYLIFLIAFTLLCGSAQAQTDKEPVIHSITTLDDCNVVWKIPSKNSLGSMPAGNGDIGVNLWVEENGDLLFYLSKTD
ncbi:MAG: DUF5703 domain-containing protein, partial [Bacteroidales bacterium]|nr:DUF5703 domain-containing protein [Bacteroidales bacterium]